MAQLGCMLRTGVMALGAVMFAGGLAVAQTAPAPAAPKAQAPALSPKAQAPAPKGQAAVSEQNPGPDQSGSGGAHDDSSESVPILAVTSLEIWWPAARRSLGRPTGFDGR